jgi:3-hydroxyisobutyrate dehydrogenase-like beta-hydroxyacid dehydrogenase
MGESPLTRWVCRLGLTGLVMMGQPIPRNLPRARYRGIVVHSRSRGPNDRLPTNGAERGGGPAGVAVRCGAVMGWPDGLINAARPGLLLIGMGTGDCVATRQIDQELAPRDVVSTDAPVSDGQRG